MREPGGALDQRADRRALKPEDEIPLPVAGNRSVLGLGRPLTDHDLVGHEVLATTSPRPRDAQRSPGAQTRGQLPASARRDPGYTATGRSPHDRYASTHHPGSRPATGSDLLRAPRLRPPSVLARTITSTDPLDLRTPYRDPVRALDNPERRSCTYRRSSAFTASLTGLGRRERRSACHWAVDAR